MGLDSEIAFGAVVPLDDELRDVADADPWRLLAEGRGLLVTRHEPPSTQGTVFGSSLSGTSAFGRAMQTVLERAGGAASAGTGGLYRVELPPGTSGLVRAVGGGYRGVATAAGSTKFAAQARLVPVAGAAAAGGAALGPLLAVMALTVGVEMLARHQLEQRLARIAGSVAALRFDVRQTRTAQLDSAEEALQKSAAALLDRIAIPSAIGLGDARNQVRVLLKQGLGWLEGWERAAEGLQGKASVDHGQVIRQLAVTDSAELAERVTTLYRALVLDSRAEVVTAAEAALSGNGRPLDHLHASVAASLARNAEVEDRLRDVLWALGEPRLTTSLASKPGTADRVTLLDRTLSQLGAGMARTVQPLPALNALGGQRLDVAHQGGQWQLLEP